MPAPTVAGTLLRAALTGHLWRTAGARALPAQTAQAVEEGSPRAPAALRRPVSEAAAWRLVRMLNGDQRALVPQWLAIAEAAERELPAHWLPPVLEQLEEPLQRRFKAVLGPKAAWLIELNPRWRHAPTEPSQELWESGTLEQRLAQLRLVRQQDPERGRAWLAQSWPSETPEGRSRLLAALRTGLGPADEAFLEEALADRRKEVRRVAVECLIRLPESAHARRGWERVQGLITAKAGLRKLNLSIQLPAALDAAAQRDGLELKPPAGLVLGERSWWLRQMLGRTPPERWSERFKCTPAAFLEALERAEHGPELVPSLAAAALLYPQEAWCAALFEHMWRGGVKRAYLHLEDLRQLLCSVPVPEQEPLLLEFVNGADPGLLQGLMVNELTWSPKTTRAAFNRVRKLLNTSRPMELASLARHADLASAQQELAAMLKRLPQESHVRSQLEPLTETLDFRATMTKELMGDG